MGLYTWISNEPINECIEHLNPVPAQRSSREEFRGLPQNVSKAIYEAKKKERKEDIWDRHSCEEFFK